MFFDGVVEIIGCSKCQTCSSLMLRGVSRNTENNPVPSLLRGYAKVEPLSISELNEFVITAEPQLRCCFGFSRNNMSEQWRFHAQLTYDANLRFILSYLPSNVTAQKGLFYNGSIGQELNRFYVTGMYARIRYS
ncbi:hypothetical protein Bca52824_022149 [Brassica carinata]|uniref:Uncharacterized protein n=1 Tax=Brassica carinata TaxID=52824 RepID=A0A8X7VFY7_BRACI|nr:hypothetical protein Bca52824_022149 [Brassica carinata]